MSQPSPHSDHEPSKEQGAASWKSREKPGLLATATRLVFLVVIALMLVLPFTPFAGRIKRGLKDLIEAARAEHTKVVTRDVPREVVKTIEVPKEVVKEVVKTVEVPAPPPPLPEKYVPRKEVDVASLYNGITIKTNLMTEQGTFASLERLDPEAYKVEFQLKVRVPKANQSVQELARINPKLPAMLPDLGAMVAAAKVSPFYHKLYDNKTTVVERDLTRLNRILDRHNFFDCETILEMRHPTSQRKALLIQSEMDVVADGSDGDRMDKLDEYIYLSDYYQPFTSYAWSKRTKKANPLLSRWESRLAKAKDEYAVKGLSAARNQELKSLISQLQLEIRDLKARSSLIADKDPFIVISLLFRPYAGSNPFTPQIGDYAVVIHDDKIYPAICGDYGPTMKMGEASLRIAKAVNPQATPYRRPESDLKVTYVIFPGTAEKPFAPPDLPRWREKCDAYLKELGGIGSGFTLHEWEDLLKPVPPPTPAVPADGAAPAPATGVTPAATVAPPGAAAGAESVPAATPSPPLAPSNEAPVTNGRASIPAASAPAVGR